MHVWFGNAIAAAYSGVATTGMSAIRALTLHADVADRPAEAANERAQRSLAKKRRRRSTGAFDAMSRISVTRCTGERRLPTEGKKVLLNIRVFCK